MPKPQQTLARQELTIMKIVWGRGAVTVRDVYEALRARKPVAYTTVLTTMNILEDKGYLKKETRDRAFRYRPARPERTVVTSMIREFVNRVFEGASRPLLLHLVRETRLTPAERRELVRLIRRIDKP